MGEIVLPSAPRPEAGRHRARRIEQARRKSESREQSELTETLNRARNGDEASFTVLYRAIQPRLLRYLTVLVGSEAEDVAAEAWLQICRELPRFRGGVDDFRGWTATIARHRALDHRAGKVDGKRAGVANLLAAASATAADGQVLVGEHGALAAFREARRHDARTPRRHRVVKTVLANVVAGKVAAATVTAAAMGGVSLAAATGHLPGPLQDAAHSAFGAPAASAPGAPGHGGPGGAIGGAPAGAGESGSAPQGTSAPTAPPTGQAGAPATSAAPASSAPHASRTGLCKAYQAHEARQAGKRTNPNADRYLSSRAFSVLISAAGGADGVESYCTALVGPAPTRPSHRGSSDRPTRPARPTHSARSHPGSSARPTRPARPTHSAPSHPGPTGGGSSRAHP